MGLADQTVIKEQAIELPLDAQALETESQWATRLDALGCRSAQAELLGTQVSQGQVVVHRRVHVRYAGSDSALVVNYGDGDVHRAFRARFEAAYRQRFAFLMQG
jgi:5-oxoprolinase (ATP-hydrolysing)